jgi:phage-related minor tail protein
MNSKLLLIAGALFISGTSLTGCSNATPAEKVENAQTKVDEANKNLDNATDAYVADITSYRAETNAKIAANEQTIADLKAKTEAHQKDDRDAYTKKLGDLEQKNTELKMRLAVYKPHGKDDWEKFKAAYIRDMVVLGVAFNEITGNKGK